MEFKVVWVGGRVEGRVACLGYLSPSLHRLVFLLLTTYVMYLLCPPQGRLVHTMFGRKKTDYVNSAHNMSLTLSPSSPLIKVVLHDLLSFSSYAHTPPDQSRLIKTFPSAKSQLMNLNFVPFALSCQALAVQLYRACMQRGSAGQLPVNMHVDMLQVCGYYGIL